MIDCATPSSDTLPPKARALDHCAPRAGTRWLDNLDFRSAKRGHPRYSSRHLCCLFPSKDFIFRHNHRNEAATCFLRIFNDTKRATDEYFIYANRATLLCKQRREFAVLEITCSVCKELLLQMYIAKLAIIHSVSCGK